MVAFDKSSKSMCPMDVPRKTCRPAQKDNEEQFAHTQGTYTMEANIVSYLQKSMLHNYVLQCILVVFKYPLFQF